MAVVPDRFSNPVWVVAVVLYLLSIVDAVVTQTYSPGYLAILAAATFYLFRR